jgi:hypothetical protein
MGRRRHRNGSRFVQLFWYVLDSPAYQSLSSKARALLIEICRRYDGANNGRLILSVREAAERLGCHTGTAVSAFRELVARGFVEVAKRGAFSLKYRHATEWRLTFYRCDVTGALPRRAFERHSDKKNTVRDLRCGGTGNPHTRSRPEMLQQCLQNPHTMIGAENPHTCTSNHRQGGGVTDTAEAAQPDNARRHIPSPLTRATRTKHHEH